MTRDDPQRFVIVTLPRSGSYHLVSLLDSAQDVRCYGEVFKKPYIELPSLHRRAMGMKKTDTKDRDDDGPGFLADMFQLEDAPIQGFKAFLEHLKPAGLSNPEDLPDWKYIYLSRNGVSSFVSGKRAENTGVYVIKDDDEPDADVRYQPIRIDIERLEDWLNWQDRLTAQWTAHRDTLGRDRIHLIDYRDLENVQALEAVLAFLGSSAGAQTLSSQMNRQFDKPFWDGVENAEELRAFLANSRWAHLMADL